MFLIELFDSPVEIKWSKKPRGYNGEFNVDSKGYKIMANVYPMYDLVDNVSEELNYWAEKDPMHAAEKAEEAQNFLNVIEHIGAEQYIVHIFTDDKNSIEVTGGGNTKAVLSTVLNSFQELKKMVGTNVFSFSAREKSRQKLYDRVFKRNKKLTYLNRDGSKEYVVII